MLGALDGDVGAGAHRDADVGLRQRRRIVDAVAGHRDALTLRLQPLDHGGLLVWQDVRFHAIDADRPGDRGGGDRVVAGQHHDLHAFAVQRVDRFPRRWLHGIGDPEQAGGLAVDCHEHHSLTLAPQRLGTIAGHDNAGALEMSRAADRDRVPVDRAGHSQSGC